MKTFQILSFFALIAASMAFAPNQLSQGESDSVRRRRDDCDPSQVAVGLRVGLRWLKAYWIHSGLARTLP